MADRNLELALRMRADLQQARRQLQQVESELGQMAQGSDRAQRGMRKLGREADRTERSLKGVSGTVGSLRGLLTTLGAGLALRQLTRATDTYTSLHSQIRLVTDSQEELNEVFADLYQLANETRQGLDPTVNLYARMARATEELNLSHEQLLTLTKAINQSFIISGASAQEAAASTLQFSQGLASGTLRGEELNSVLENSPVLARALAEGLGVTIGELRKLGEQGQLTAENLVRALFRTADGIGDKFGGMTRTVGQALQQLRNDLLVTFGSGDAEGFVEAIDELREIITDPGFQQSMVELVTTSAEIASGFAKATGAIAEFTRWAAESAAARIHGPAAGDTVRIDDAIERAESRLATLQQRRAELAEEWQQVASFARGEDANTPPPSLQQADADIDALEQRLERLRRLREDALKPPRRSDSNTGTDSKDNEGEGGNDPIIPGGGGGGTSELEKARSALLNLDAGLQQQIATFGEGEAAVLEYRLTLGDLADDVARLGAEGDALAASIVRQAEEVQALAKAEEKRAAAERERQQAQQQAEADLQRILDQANPVRVMERQLELIERLKAEFPQYAASLDQAAGKVRNRIGEMNQGLVSAQSINAEFAYGASGALDSFAQDIANGRDAIDSLGESFRQFAADFLRQIAQMIIQQTIFNALQSITGGGGGGIYANVAAYHGGGVVGEGGTARGLYANVPRYHTGGVAGLAPDEVPAILRKGEEVLTTNDPRHRYNQDMAGMGRERELSIINTFNEGEMVQAALSTRVGQKAVFNLISRNRKQVKQLLS